MEIEKRDTTIRNLLGMTPADNYLQVMNTIPEDKVTLVAVSKTQPAEKIKQVYDLGQRDFGENKVQELITKAEMLPPDIRWHLIGHLQSNKVKYIAGFISLIHSVDSLALLKEINKQAQKSNRVIDCLLEIYIAAEETKYGLSEEETLALLEDSQLGALQNIRIRGLMGMASYTQNNNQVRGEFRKLRSFFAQLKSGFFRNAPEFNILSMGMSGDYILAIEEGSTMVRVGSAIFGERGK